MSRPVFARGLLRRGRVAVLFPLLGIGLTLAGCYYVVPAPPPYAMPVPAPPPPGAVYVPGQWIWNGAAWVWRPPYWAAAPRPAPPPAPPPPAAIPPPPGPPPPAPKS